MSETFRGKSGTVRFSSGAIEALLRSWLEVGELLARTPDERAVLEWLRQRLDEMAPGGRAFPLDPPPPELASAHRLNFLARLVAATAMEIASGQPASIPEVNWTDALRGSWLMRLQDLYLLIQEALPASETLPPLEELRRLAPKDRMELQLQRLLDGLERRRGAGAEEVVAAIDAILAHLQSSGLVPERGALVARLLMERADALLEMGDAHGAAAALEQAAIHEQDPALRTATLDRAAAIRKRATLGEGNN